MLGPHQPTTESHMTTSVAETAKTIRTALKAAGIGNRQVSVRAKSYSMGSSVNVEILDLSVDMALVKKIAMAHETCRRCEVTGDVLSGGNRFIFVTVDSGAMSAYVASNPTVNGFVIETGNVDEFFGYRWPEGDFPKAATATVRAYSLSGAVRAALMFE